MFCLVKSAVLCLPTLVFNGPGVDSGHNTDCRMGFWYCKFLSWHITAPFSASVMYCVSRPSTYCPLNQHTSKVDQFSFYYMSLYISNRCLLLHSCWKKIYWSKNKYWLLFYFFKNGTWWNVSLFCWTFNLTCCRLTSFFTALFFAFKKGSEKVCCVIALCFHIIQYMLLSCYSIDSMASLWVELCFE